ncbi:MAG: Nramp family divalent metal transporter [Candidatus Saccharimonas sp.]
MVQKTQKVLTLLGPAFVAAVAYVDPGNFAANFSAGAQYGYMLLWVLIVANVMAMLVQYLSAKVGVVTGMSLPEVVATKLGRKSRIAYWVQAELVAASCDLAEVIGGAIALKLLFNVPLVAGGVITGLVSLLLLATYSRRGQKTYERLIIGMLIIIPIGFLVGLAMHPPDPGAMLAGVVPRLEGKDTVLLAVAMLGATIMPHVVYLHSALSRNRHGKLEGKKLAVALRATKIDVVIAMVCAGSVNIAMLLLAASALRGSSSAESLEGIFMALGHTLAPLVAWLFALGLLVSGFASTAVGTQAGEVIMAGLLKRRIHPLIRRTVVIVPSIILLAFAVDPTQALIISQVVLSFGIPFALTPLALAASSKRIMGEARTRRPVTIAIFSIAGFVSVLNIVLIWLTFFG